MPFNSIFLKISYTSLALLMPILSVQGDWSSAENISTEGQYAFEGTVKVDAFGNTTSLWTAYNGSNYIIQSSSQSLEGTWTDPISISFTGQDSFAPQIGIDSYGNAVAVWFSFDGSNYVIQASTQNANNSYWATASTISTLGQNAYYPELAVDSLGNAVAAWYAFDGNNYIVQSASFTRSNGWSSPIQASVSGQDSFDTGIGVDDLGNAVVAWYTFDGSNYVVQAAALPFGSDAWSPPTSISTSGLDGYNPRIAVDSSGDAIAVWYEYDGANYRVASSYLPFRGRWTSPPIYVSPEGQDGYSPEIAINSSGNAITVWEQFNNAISCIFSASLSNNSSSWSTPIQISTVNLNAYAPQISINLSSDNAIAAWYRFDGTFYNIETAVLPYGGNWSLPSVVSPNGVFSTNPAAALDDIGDAVIIWSDNTNQAISASNGSNLF